MSSVLTCQDLSFVGGQRNNCPYIAPTSADSVDVTMETLASSWAADRPDYACCQGPAETLACFNYGTPPDPLWTPQLTRNKQLQDALTLREEELARLQHENNKLKQFVNSSFVKNLEEKSKRLLSAKKSRKRNLHAEEVFQNLSASQLLLRSQVKRACRNLSLEFCSAEELASTPPLEHWVLQTLGLKDADTIDTSPERGFTSTEHCFTSPERGFSASFDSATERSPDQDPSDNYCRATGQETSNYKSPTDATDPCPCIDPSANYTPTFKPMNNYTVSGDSCSDVTATGPAVQFSPNYAVSPKYHVTPFLSPLPRVNHPLSPAEIQHFSPMVASSPVLSQDRCPRLHHPPRQHCQGLSSSPRGPGSQHLSSSPRGPGSQHLSSSPRGPGSQQLSSSPRGPGSQHLSSSPRGPGSQHLSSSPRGPGSQHLSSSPRGPGPRHHSPSTLRSRTDVAFSMSLSSSSSVKTHSFSQGQAFVRKDTQGGWSFTWVPKQGP